MFFLKYNKFKLFFESFNKHKLKKLSRIFCNLLSSAYLTLLHFKISYRPSFLSEGVFAGKSLLYKMSADPIPACQQWRERRLSLSLSLSVSVEYLLSVQWKVPCLYFIIKNFCKQHSTRDSNNLWLLQVVQAIDTVTGELDNSDDYL